MAGIKHYQTYFFNIFSDGAKMDLYLKVHLQQLDKLEYIIFYDPVHS